MVPLLSAQPVAASPNGKPSAVPLAGLPFPCLMEDAEALPVSAAPLPAPTALVADLPALTAADNSVPLSKEKAETSGKPAAQSRLPEVAVAAARERVAVLLAPAPAVEPSPMHAPPPAEEGLPVDERPADEPAAEAQLPDVQPTPQPPSPPVLPSPRSFGRAPGLEREEAKVPGGERGLESRSVRAAERTLAPQPSAEPAVPVPTTGSVGPAAPVATLPVEGPAAPAAASSGAMPIAVQSQPRAAEAALSAAPVPQPSVAFHSPRFAEEVGLAIARRAPAGLSGTDEMVLRIEPTHLGRIEVQLRFDDRGGLEAVLSADQPRVLEQLRLGSADLHRALVDNSGRTDVAPLRFEGRTEGFAATSGQGSSGNGQQAGGQGQPGQHGQGRAQVHAQAGDLLPDLPPAFQRLRAAGGRVDLIA